MLSMTSRSLVYLLTSNIKKTTIPNTKRKADLRRVDDFECFDLQHTGVEKNSQILALSSFQFAVIRDLGITWNILCINYNRWR